jgi:hypothetical protein
MDDSLQVTPMTNSSQVVSVSSSDNDACFVIETPGLAEAAGNIRQGLSELLEECGTATGGEQGTRTEGPIPERAAKEPTHHPPLPNTPETGMRHASPSPARMLGAMLPALGSDASTVRVHEIALKLMTKLLNRLR